VCLHGVIVLQIRHVLAASTRRVGVVLCRR
jgi:hypothetical protein